MGGVASQVGSEVLEKFFSSDMFGIRHILQWVEWNIDMGNSVSELMSMNPVGPKRYAALAGEMSTAYGTDSGFYDVSSTWNVELYNG